MATRGRGTINLKNGRMRDNRPQIERETTTRSAVPEPLAPAPTVLESLEWTAFEHEQVDFGPSWYVVPGGIMAILFALALWAQNYFFALFVVIAFGTFVLLRNQPPKKIHFTVSKDGVRAGKTFYQMSRIRSFWIFPRSEHPELSIETTQVISSYVRLPLGDTDQQEVREFLLTLLPEKQHPQFLMDEIMRIMGF